jgi:hypothetical protein
VTQTFAVEPPRGDAGVSHDCQNRRTAQHSGYQRRLDEA